MQPGLICCHYCASYSSLSSSCSPLPRLSANSGHTYGVSAAVNHNYRCTFTANCMHATCSCLLTHPTHIQFIPTPQALTPPDMFAAGEAQCAPTKLPIRPFLGPHSRCGPFQQPEDGTFALVTPHQSRFQAPGIKFTLARQPEFRPTSCLALDGQAQYGQSDSDTPS